MRKRYFWQDTHRTLYGTVVVYYDNGLLVPTVYLRGGGRSFPQARPASDFVGRDAANQREWSMGLISGAIGAAATPARGGTVSDAAFQKAHPVLFAFLTLTEEDGVRRTPSSLVLFTEGTEFKACLTERDANLKLWRSAETFQGLLKAFETALASGQADWRRGHDPGSNGKPPGRRK